MGIAAVSRGSPQRPEELLRAPGERLDQGSACWDGEREVPWSVVKRAADAADAADEAPAPLGWWREEMIEVSRSPRASAPCTSRSNCAAPVSKTPSFSNLAVSRCRACRSCGGNVAV